MKRLIVYALLVSLALAGAEPSVLVLVDKAYATPGSSVDVAVLLANLSGVKSITVRLLQGQEVLSQVTLPAVDKAAIALQAPNEQGVYEIEVLANSSEIATLARVREPLPVVSESSWGEPLLLAFVWHCHQGINMLPDGTFHGPWAFYHVYSNEFEPYYGSGAYALHATLLEKHPSIKATINWSPSLLWQWLYATRFGYVDGTRSTYVDPSSAEVMAVRRLLGHLKTLAAEGRMEVLTSFFNHPIPGYVAERFEWGIDALSEELEWGFAVTKLAFNLTPKGVWIPEMFFSMKLLDLLHPAVSYIVLDARYHLSASEGDVGTPYEVYVLRAGERELAVFFRDSELSDFISFSVNPTSGEEAYALARRFVANVIARRLTHPSAHVVVVAADGENWLLGNSLKAVFFDAALSLLENCSSLVRTATLSEVLSSSPPQRTLVRIPTTSWAGGDWVWTSRSENKLQWSLINDAGRRYVSIKRSCPDTALSTAAAFSLFMALNSDVIHIEYVMPKHTDAWCKQLEMICRRGKAEAEKLLQRHMTPDLSSLNVLIDCVACKPSLFENAPQLAAALVVAIAVLLAYKLQKKLNKN